MIPVWRDKWFQTIITKTSDDDKTDNEKMIAFTFLIRSRE